MTTHAAAETEPGDLAGLDEFSRREKLRYQSFELACGQATEGHNRSYLNELAFDGGIDGRAVLDIGCNLGYFCIRMSRSFLFTGKAMEVLFNGHTELFEPLIVRPSPFTSGGSSSAIASPIA
jgi:hypothetical protein